MTTLAMIKSKDPKIYEKETVFYKRSQGEGSLYVSRYSRIDPAEFVEESL